MMMHPQHHLQNHDYASSAAPTFSNATLEMHSIEIERDADDYDDYDEIDDESEDQHHDAF